MHEDTAYGIVSENAADRDRGNLVYRKTLDALTLKDADRVRAPDLRARFIALRDASGSDQNSFTAALRAWAKADADAAA